MPDRLELRVFSAGGEPTPALRAPLPGGDLHG